MFDTLRTMQNGVNDHLQDRMDRKDRELREGRSVGLGTALLISIGSYATGYGNGRRDERRRDPNRDNRYGY